MIRFIIDIKLIFGYLWFVLYNNQCLHRYPWFFTESWSQIDIQIDYSFPMDICAPQAPTQERIAHWWGHWDGQGSCKWGAWAQEFVGPAGWAPARQRDFAAAPANKSLNIRKRAAPGAGGCTAMKTSGSPYVVVPRSNGEKRPKSPENNNY